MGLSRLISLSVSKKQSFVFFFGYKVVCDDNNNINFCARPTFRRNPNAVVIYM